MSLALRNTMGSGAESQPSPGSPSPPKAIRIAVRCQSHKIPGERGERMKTMGNIICQHHWHRDMDSSIDRIMSLGCLSGDGEKVHFLLDSGELAQGEKEEDIPIRMYRWNGRVWYVNGIPV